MITAEQSKALRKAGLGHVCEFNGKIRNSKDFSELSPKEMERAQQILAGQGSSPKRSHTGAKGPLPGPPPPKDKRAKK